MFDESDEDEWCAYMYSLAEFMWKKGILTDDIRNRVIEMIDSDFAMKEWIAAGSTEEKKRRKVLEKFRDMIISPQCAPKKIKLDLHMEDIFEDGEYVVVQKIRSNGTQGSSGTLSVSTHSAKTVTATV